MVPDLTETGKAMNWTREEAEAYFAEQEKLPPEHRDRWFYFGHKVLWVYGGSKPPGPKHRWAMWECQQCTRQWESEDGLICPSCSAKCKDYENYVEKP